jgi:hypothetical protein
METTAMIYHIIQEGPGTGMIAACTSDPNGERNREPEERCNIPDAPHFTTLRKAHKSLRDTVGREPSPMEMEGSTLVDEDERSRNNSARRATNPTYLGQNGNTLHTIAHSTRADTRMFVAMSHKTMTHTIHMLTRDPNPLVRAYAIAHPNAPLEDTETAINDTDYRVVAAAARVTANRVNLAKAATHERWEVRQVAAENEHAPSGALHALARDPHVVVRASVARNKTLTEDVRMILTHDPDPRVRVINAENATQSRVLAIAARDTEPDVAVAAAINESTVGSDLAHLATHSDERVRRMVALNKSTPEETALALTYDEDNMVRAGAGAHKNTPVWRKKELAQEDTEPIVLNFLINSTDTPLCVIRIMAERGNRRARNYLAPEGELDARRQRAALARVKRTARPWLTMTGWGNL